MIFTDMRMSTNADVQNAAAYPLRPFMTRTKRRKCSVCNLYPALYVTYGDRLASENPFFYCEECFQPLHYDVNGDILYSDFNVYNYGMSLVVLARCTPPDSRFRITCADHE